LCGLRGSMRPTWCAKPTCEGLVEFVQAPRVASTAVVGWSIGDPSRKRSPSTSAKSSQASGPPARTQSSRAQDPTCRRVRRLVGLDRCQYLDDCAVGHVACLRKWVDGPYLTPDIPQVNTAGSHRAEGIWQGRPRQGGSRSSCPTSGGRGSRALSRMAAATLSAEGRVDSSRPNSKGFPRARRHARWVEASGVGLRRVRQQPGGPNDRDRP
jgi:hypothetical protein